MKIEGKQTALLTTIIIFSTLVVNAGTELFGCKHSSKSLSLFLSVQKNSKGLEHYFWVNAPSKVDFSIIQIMTLFQLQKSN